MLTSWRVSVMSLPFPLLHSESWPSRVHI